jgi:hypothetical protein
MLFVLIFQRFVQENEGVCTLYSIAGLTEDGGSFMMELTAED